MKKSNNWEKVMKNGFRLLLAAFVLVGMSSCTLMTDGGNLGEGSESLAFCFRAPTGTSETSKMKLTVSISDGKYTQTFETDFNGGAVSHEFKKVPVRKKISVYAKVEEYIQATGKFKPVYDGFTDIAIKKGKNSVTLGLNPFSGYFWLCNGNKEIFRSYSDITNLSAKPNPLKTLLTPDPVGSQGVPDESVVDYCFAPNGVVWMVIYSSTNLGGGSYNEDTKIAVAKRRSNSIDKDIGIVFGSEQSPILVTTVAADGDILYFGGVKYSAETDRQSPWLCAVTNDGTYNTKVDLSSSVLSLTSPEGAPIVEMVTDVAVAGKNIYIKYSNQDGSSEYIRRGIINEGGKTIIFGPTAIFSTENLKSFAISDMTAIDNDLYILLIDNGVGLSESNHSRGMLVKIDDLGQKTEVGLHSNDKGNGSVKLYIMDDSNPTRANMINRNFVGPRRFVAIKPKELVIADAGVVIDSKQGPKLKKRIVTIDLMNITNSFSGKDLSWDGFFDGNVRVDNSGNIIYSTDFNQIF